MLEQKATVVKVSKKTVTPVLELSLPLALWDNEGLPLKV